MYASLSLKCIIELMIIIKNSNRYYFQYSVTNISHTQALFIFFPSNLTWVFTNKHNTDVLNIKVPANFASGLRWLRACSTTAKLSVAGRQRGSQDEGNGERNMDTLTLKVDTSGVFCLLNYVRLVLC